jgi:hypothetical protein
MYEVGQIMECGTAAGGTTIRLNIAGTVAADLVRKKEIRKAGIWLDDGRMISADQRKKIYASIRDFSEYTGYPPEEAKEVLKYLYVARTGRQYFSLADCSMDTAGEFINLIIDICLENGIILSDSLYNRADNIEYMLRSCLKNRKCAICGRSGEVHHWDAIGMGNDRRHYDDSGNRKICLCRTHHTQAHAYGRERFMKMYHVCGIYYDENSDGVLIDENRKGGGV